VLGSNEAIGLLDRIDVLKGTRVHPQRTCHNFWLHFSSKREKLKLKYCCIASHIFLGN
jgi:hypothetical protein